MLWRFFLSGAAREVAQVVCLPGRSRALGSVLSTACSGVVAPARNSRPEEAEAGRTEVQGHSGLDSHLEVNVSEI